MSKDMGLGERSREELAAMFGRGYTGWDRGVNVYQDPQGRRQLARAPFRKHEPTVHTA